MKTFPRLMAREQATSEHVLAAGANFRMMFCVVTGNSRGRATPS